MKNSVILFAMMVGISLTGCNPKEDTPAKGDDSPVKQEEPPKQEESPKEEEPSTTATLVFKASAEDVNAGNTKSAKSETKEDFTFFVSDDLLWYDATTNEVVFASPLAPNDTVEAKSLKFYVGEEYLFSSVITLWMNHFEESVYNSLVFYYTAVDNKYYLKDGYPEVDKIAEKYPDAQLLRDEYMKKIQPQWDKFVEQLKKEDKYKESGKI
jgi:hypothetical protein